MKYLSYWMLPVASGVVWLATLLGLLLYWIVVTDREIYGSMQDGQRIAYISDVGASKLKPLFVVGCVLTTVLLDLAFLADRWLRHRRRLVPNVSRSEKILFGLSIVSAAVGTVGLVCLAGFDTARYPRLHNVFLCLFIGGYLFSAIFLCAEFQRLGKKYRQHRSLTISFWVKLVFIIVEVALLIAFGATVVRDQYDAAAVLEWTISFIFSLYVFSFAVDLLPALRTGPYAAEMSQKWPPYSLRPMNTLEARELGRERAEEQRYVGHRPAVEEEEDDDDLHRTASRLTQDNQRALEAANGRHPPQAPIPGTDSRDF